MKEAGETDPKGPAGERTKKMALTQKKEDTLGIFSVKKVFVATRWIERSGARLGRKD